MNKYYHFKEILKELKQGSNSLIDSLDLEKSKILSYKQKLIKKLENRFASSLMKIEDYKAELKTCLKDVRIQAKNEIFKGNIANSTNVGAQLFRSVYKRRELFDTKPCQVNLFEEKFDEMLENVCRVTLKDTKKIFSDNSLLVFIRKSSSILQVSLETSNFEEIKLENPVKP